MTASEAVSTSLRVVTAPSTSQDESKSRRLAYLNALVKMWQKRDPNSDDGLRLHEVMLWYVFISIILLENLLYRVILLYDGEKCVILTSNDFALKHERSDLFKGGHERPV